MNVTLFWCIMLFMLDIHNEQQSTYRLVSATWQHLKGAPHWKHGSKPGSYLRLKNCFWLPQELTCFCPPLLVDDTNPNPYKHQGSPAMMHVHHPQVGLGGWYWLGFQQILFQCLEAMNAQRKHFHQPTYLFCFCLRFVAKSVLMIFLERKTVWSTHTSNVNVHLLKSKPKITVTVQEPLP